MPRAAIKNESIAPMLQTLVEKAPEGGNWLHEIKYDGIGRSCGSPARPSRCSPAPVTTWTEKPLLKIGYFRSEDQGKLIYSSRVSKQMFPYIFRYASRSVGLLYTDAGFAVSRSY